MSRTITVSDRLFTRLEAAARERGLAGIEQLLETWQANEDELARRAETVKRITALREELFSVYGEMPDSVELIREDRER